MFLRSPKDPLQFFPILQTNGCSKIPKASILHLQTYPYTTYRRLQENNRKKIRIFFQFFLQAGTVEENTPHFEVLLVFLSHTYGAQLGISRFVYKCHDPKKV